MDHGKRRTLRAALGALLLPAVARSQAPVPDVAEIRINVPGPHSLPFLPIDLIPLLGFDRETGASLVVRHHPSGVRAVEDMFVGNADFAALGFPVVPMLHARGKDIVGIATISGRASGIMLVLRKDLAGDVRSVADLKGRTIGTAVGSADSKSYPQMACGALLRKNGVAENQVRWLPTAQNWGSLSGALLSRSADAIFSEEPFASRLIASGLGVVLADLSDPATGAEIPNLDHLRRAVVAPRVLTQRQPEKVDIFVRVLRRSLAWIRITPPEQVARMAPVEKEERREIATLLAKMPDIFSADARFVTSELAATDLFLRAALPDKKLAPTETLIDDRWAGRRK